jgi:DNA-directed RNA polymerase subunit RPC12/RpoP
MNGAAQVFFMGVAYGHLLSGVAGGSGGGDEPPWQPASSDATAPAAQRRRKQKPPSSASSSCKKSEGRPYQCPVCDRRFNTEKAVHGHMRSHPDRAWRGMEEPRPPSVHGLQKHYRYACEHCGAQFETRQALGGHRASHNGKMGCFSLSKQPKPSRHVLPFDLNDPLPEQQDD